jgi:DNA-binding FadR family transcriptional regulator
VTISGRPSNGSSSEPINVSWSRRRALSTATPSRPGRAKLAEVLAAEIEAEIIRRGWPVGANLGTEVELLDHYDVSRAVLREAIRLLEHHFIAEMRRGRNGGLVITQPDPAIVADTVALFLRYRTIRAEDVMEVRQALEMTAVRLAAEGASEEGIRRLRATAVSEKQVDDVADLPSPSAAFHELIAELSGNPAIHLFVQIVTMLTETLVDHSPAERSLEGVHQAHGAIAEAIASGDTSLAQRRMRRHFEAMADVGIPMGRPPKQRGPLPRDRAAL